MPLILHQIQYEQLSKFGKETIIRVMEDGSSVRQVASQVILSDLTVRRCWDEWTKEKTNCLNDRCPDTDSTFTMCPCAFPNLSKVPRCRTSGITYGAHDTHPRCLMGVVLRTTGLYCNRMKPVVFSDKSRFDLSSDGNRFRVRKSRSERFSPVIALQRHPASTAGLTVWGVIADDIRSPLISIHGTIIAQGHVHDILQAYVLSLMIGFPGSIFQQKMLGHIQQGCHKTVSTTLPHFHGLLDQQIFITIQAYLRSFETASWTTYEFGSNKMRVYSNCGPRYLKTSYRACLPQCLQVSHRASALEGDQQKAKISIHLYFFLQ
ncbi:uncharacterized protein TNCV_3885181 [Trichonephila clavipes]|nr:uncharacterized protein TNCV_3885181 [Trichonephila clavipes]